MRTLHARGSVTLGTLAACLLASGCNPLIYDDVLERVYVEDFTMRSPSGAPTHSDKAVVFAPTGTGEQFEQVMLMGSEDDSTMVLLRLNAGGAPIETYPTLEEVNAITFPNSAQLTPIGGMAEVPDPNGNGTPTAIASFLNPAELEKSRIVPFTVPGFGRLESMSQNDLNAPSINGECPPSWGRLIAAANLDGDSRAPGSEDCTLDASNYEVAVDSEIGLTIFDSVGLCEPTYEMNLETVRGMDPDSVTGANEAQGYGFTLCPDLQSVNGLTSGPFGVDGRDVFVVATTDGLTLVGAGATRSVNLVGAPVYECALETRAVPGGSTSQFGQHLLVDDLDVDGDLDLLVADPGANLVHFYATNADGSLPNTPTSLIEPYEADGEPPLEYGFNMKVVELGPAGTLEKVLLVGAPGTEVGGKEGSGRIYVYDLPSLSPLIGTDNMPRTLEDQTPSGNTRFGTWVGGLYRDETHEEIIVMGTGSGRVHVAVNADDPPP